jgi:hypothetical protein
MEKARAKKSLAYERKRQALELWKAGVPLTDMAVRLGYSNASGALKAVNAGLRETLRPAAEALREGELQRLDALQLSLWADAKKGKTQAVTEIRKIIEVRCKLLGLFAPVKVETEVTTLMPITIVEVVRASDDGTG